MIDAISTQCVSSETCRGTTRRVAFRYAAHALAAENLRAAPDSGVIPCGNRTRRSSTHCTFDLIIIMRNSDSAAQLALFTVDIIVLRTDCYVGVCATHALP